MKLKLIPDLTNTQKWLAVAESMDSMRLFPRLLLLSDFIFTCWYCYFALNTVVELVTITAVKDSGLISAISAVVISGTIPFITHRFTKVADIYLTTGRKWGTDDQK